MISSHFHENHKNKEIPKKITYIIVGLDDQLHGPELRPSPASGLPRGTEILLKFLKLFVIWWFWRYKFLNFKDLSEILEEYMKKSIFGSTKENLSYLTPGVLGCLETASKQFMIPGTK